METKSDKVRELVAAQDFKAALAIVKTFKLGFTRKEKEVLQRAHEAQWNPSFYIKLGYNPASLMADAIKILSQHYTG